MSQVSRRLVSKDVQKRMYEVFLDSIARVKKREEVLEFINDFLTPTERVMLPKRLSIAYLLYKGYDQRRISQLLKVSFTTITRVSAAMKYGGKGYERVIQSLIADVAMKELLGSIDDALEKVFGGLPIMPGSGNWSRWKIERRMAKREARDAY